MAGGSSVHANKATTVGEDCLAVQVQTRGEGKRVRWCSDDRSEKGADKKSNGWWQGRGVRERYALGRPERGLSQAGGVGGGGSR